MDRHITATVNADSASVIETLADLSTYPEWLDLVNAAERVDGDAWLITLRARLGPLARSKRLRMVRTHLDDESVRFERVETGGRDFADWQLQVVVTACGDAETDVALDLHYSGDLWTAPIERALAGYEQRAARSLAEYLNS